MGMFELLGLMKYGPLGQLFGRAIDKNREIQSDDDNEDDDNEDDENGEED